MILEGSGLLLLWIVAVVFSLLRNGDVFSPVKFFLLYLGVFFSDLFFSAEKYVTEVRVVYVGLLLTAVVLSYMEKPGQLKKISIDLHRQKLMYINIFLWIASLIPIAAQLYLIDHLGGFEAYINKIPMRVIEFKGFGAVTSLIKFYTVINLVYFAVLITVKHKSTVTNVLFSVHFFGLLIVGILSGSRGELLGNMMMMIIMYHYFASRITVRTVIVSILLLISAASVLEGGRSYYSWVYYEVMLTDEELAAREKTDQEKVADGEMHNTSIIGMEWSKYGTNPLNLVFTQPVKELQYGMTYISAITNFVPRVFWPDKPETGGVIFTKQYTDNAWNGSSYLATGVIAEGVINFGLYIGAFFGYALFSILMYMIIMWYNKFSFYRADAFLDKIAIKIAYIFIMLSVVDLFVGEFANITMNLIIKLFALATTIVLLKYASKISHINAAINVFR